MWTKEKIKEFANRIGYHSQFTSGELNTLHTILFDDEDFFGMTEGMMKKVHHNNRSGYGIALLTDKRFLFYYKSVFGKIIKEEFPLSSISSISFQKGSLLGSLHIYAANVDEIIIEQCDNNNAGRIAKAWQFLQTERNIIAADLANEQASDAAVEIEKWYALKEKGIITAEEFNSKKKQLLNL
ncbi:MAG TPA: PH domain-containing protein [Parafilimonas sp.]|nr:PH domain-containing protein [Parafilimonas sp.]